MTEEAFDELAIIAELHAPLIINPLEQNVTEDDGLSKSTHRFPQASKPEYRSLRVDTQIGPSIPVALRGPSPTLTSESDRDETRSRRAIRPVSSLPSFHLPHRARRSSYRDRGTETPDLTSTSRSSLTSCSSAISRNSGLYTPPHSPRVSSFVHAEILNSSSHLSAISELQNTENHFDHSFLHPLEVHSTEMILKTERSGSSSPSIRRSKSGGQGGVNIAPRAVPGPGRGGGQHINAQVRHSETDSDSLLSAALPRSSSAAAASSDVTFTQFPTTASASMQQSPSPSPQPQPGSRTSRAWSFGSKSSSSSSLRWGIVSSGLSLSKEEKEEKRRKKEEARARKERLAQELKKRGEAQIQSWAWEEDIAHYGNLASM